MHLTHFALLPTILLLLPTPALAQDYTTVLASISSIKSNTTSLTSAVSTVTPGVLGLPSALRVQATAVTLSTALADAAAAATASRPFGGAGSLAVGLALLDLQGGVRDALGATAAKNASFGELGPVVLAGLYALRGGTRAFGDAVVGKLDALEAGLAPGVLDAVEGYFDGAIVAYGGQAS